MVFTLVNHRSLIFYALRTVYEGDPTLLCKRHSHAVIALTACMMALTSGMFAISRACSPLRYRTRAALKSTFWGMQSVDEYPGTKRYSLKVCEGS